MGQIYMLEFLVDTVKVFNQRKTNEIEDKKIVITIGFGPKEEFVVREKDLNLKPSDSWKKDKHTHKRMWVRQLKAGKSFMFPSSPDTLIKVLRKFPLKITIWNEDASESENKIFVGIGSLSWNQQFYEWIANTVNPKIRVEPLTVPQEIQLMDDCCCVSVGYVEIIIRISAIGINSISTFEKKQSTQQTDNNVFVFKTSLSPQLYEGKQLDCDSFCMFGPLYETVTLKKPEKDHRSNEDPIKSVSSSVLNFVSNLISSSKTNQSAKIKLGDIKGMCGYSMCPMAQKIRSFLQKNDEYKINSSQDLGEVICPECGNLLNAKECEKCENLSTTNNDVNQTEEADEDYVPYPKCMQEPLSRDCTCQKEAYTNLCKVNVCECKEETIRKESRKVHKPFCSSYSHKKTCPISLAATVEEPAELTKEEAEDKKKMAASPYNLPPLHLRPCPALGKPCQAATHDVLNKDRKHGISKHVSQQSDMPLTKLEQSRCRLKISCTTEYERLKKFLDGYMKENKINNNICIDRRPLPGVRKCCDKFSQMGSNLTGKRCCTAHKFMLRTTQ